MRSFTALSILDWLKSMEDSFYKIKEPYIFNFTYPSACSVSQIPPLLHFSREDRTNVGFTAHKIFFETPCE